MNSNTLRRVSGRVWSMVFIGAVLGLIVVAVCFFIPLESDSPAAAVAATSDHSGDSTAVQLACTGRLEGLSEATHVETGIDGVLVEILVEEGQQVRAGEVVARVESSTWRSELDAARFAEASAIQGKVRLMRGHRDEERRAAASDRAAAEADLTRARARYGRFRQLTESGVLAMQELDDARRDLDVAQSVLQSAIERERLTNAPPLPEEIARADADISVARERTRTAAAMLEKCTLRAPIRGTVLRRDMRLGESASVTNPRPVVTLADLSRFRVRAEVDERDVGRVSIGQRVRIAADAFGADTFEGRVSRVEQLMGRKTIRTGDPAEKSDRDVREVLVDIDEHRVSDPRLVIGLRVTVQFLRAQ